MIAGLRIANFRSIRNQKLKLAPITILYGHNSAGKSSILYSVAVLKNVVLNPNQQSLAFFNLGFANLGDFQKVAFDHKDENFVSFEVEVDAPDGARINYEVSIRGAEGKFALRANGKFKVELKLAITLPYPLNQQDSKEIELDGRSFSVTWNGVTAQVTPKEQDPESLEKAQEIARSLNSPIEAIRKIDFVPLRRGFSKPHYSPVAQTPLLLTEDEVATYLANNMYLQGKLSTYLERILGREFRIHLPPGTAMFSLYTVEKATGLTVEVINDGFGINQIIWLLAKCLRNDADTICIEEPEIHLHPTAVRTLAQTLVGMVRRESKSFIVSTHSEALVMALLSFVAQGELKPDELCCYLAKKEEKETVLEYQEVRENGQIKGGLTSFIEAELKDLKAFLKPQE
jgi:hypothetical protein